jgi:hypothetical protein
MEACKDGSGPPIYQSGMNYYEELGLSPRADVAEIQEAYRNLVRLLHPDQHAEPRLRRLAEAQMRRLNLVRETLTDPEKRRRYDASIAEAARRKAQACFRRRLLAAVAVGAVVCLAIRMFSGGPGTGRSAKSPATGQAETAALLDSAPARRMKRDPEPAPPPRARRAAGPSATQAPAPADFVEPPALPPLVPPVSPVVPLAAAVLAPRSPGEPAPPAEASPFAGTWVYVPPRLAPREPQLYPPEYVEAVIQHAGEIVRGRYRARYRVPDRAISPVVAFQFEGSAEQSPATLAWSGPAGAAGEVRLTLLPSGHLRVDWLATSLGGQLGLASGTAVLTRRQNP